MTHNILRGAVLKNAEIYSMWWREVISLIVLKHRHCMVLNKTINVAFIFYGLDERDTAKV